MLVNTKLSKLETEITQIVLEIDDIRGFRKQHNQACAQTATDQRAVDLNVNVQARHVCGGSSEPEHAVHMQCSCSAHAVHMPCTCPAHALHMHALRMQARQMRGAFNDRDKFVNELKILQRQEKNERVRSTKPTPRGD